MQNEPADNPSTTVEDELVEGDTTPGNDLPPEPPDETKKPVDSPEGDSSENPDDKPEGNEPEAASEKQNPVNQYVDSSNVDIISILTAPHSRAYNSTFHIGTAKELKQALDVFVRVVNLESPTRTYKSLEESNVAGYSGCLRTERILLLSCRAEDVALSVAKSIAYQVNVPRKQLVTIDENEQSGYNFRNLIDALASPKKKGKAEPKKPAAICVWDADTNDEIAGGILNSLLSRNTKVEQYKCWLRERDLFLICIVPLERVQKYNDSHSGTLQSLKIDFLNPLLEHHDESKYQDLAVAIRQQRSAGRWSENDADFYREISAHLRNGNLAEAIQKRMGLDVSNDVSVEDLFNREDPIVDTVLYCATYFRDLTPQDFHYLVELFLGETTEEVTRRVTRRQDGGEQFAEVVESVPLVNRWRRNADAILRRCKVANEKNEYGKRVIDFPVVGLRNRLAQYIRNENYFFYESNFVFLKQQGLLFSPKKLIAEGARQLLVEVAAQYAPGEVARWLYEIIVEFEEMAQAADRLKDLTPRFQLLPDLRVKAARRFVAHGLSRVLMRLDKEDDELREAVRILWQRLVQTPAHHQWFLELLRRMGDATPPETLKWLKQLFDQGSDLIRLQARVYLVSYLVHKESAVYPSLKELMQWSKTSQAGRIAQEVLIVYCSETNRKLAQQDFGQWPSSHALFGFESLSEAEECLELLVSWVCTAASEVDEDNALFIVADLFAAWYFILSGPAGESGDAAGSDTELSAHVVRDLLFQRLTRHSPRAQRNALMAIWDRLRHDILEKVIYLDEFVNTITISAAPTADLLSDAATARRNLLDTRTSLSELRKAFIEWAAKTTSLKDAL
jgi:hypothetical protein